MRDLFATYSKLQFQGGDVGYFSLPALEKKLGADFSKLPYSIKVLLEALLRNCDNYLVSEESVKKLAQWQAKNAKREEIAFMPSRVLLQDFTGVPAVVDLAALRSAMDRVGGDPKKINPLIPVDLVIDHSVQIDKFGSDDALEYNVQKEFERNGERYRFLRWGQQAFDNFRVVPPATGIIHQVNLEYLANVVQLREMEGEKVALPDSLVGTDSHTTMINGLGVTGWGVGGIEAEAVMLGQPIYMLTPEVVGFRLEGSLKEGVTATDLVLTVTQMLRQHNVVGKFVEFYGPGVRDLSLADRAVLANMAPEYGATMGFFPVDSETINFMRQTGRDEATVELAESYCKAQGLFRDEDGTEPEYTSSLTLDMGSVVPSLAGPKRPQDRIALNDMKNSFRSALEAPVADRGFALEKSQLDKKVDIADCSGEAISHGAVVIASITSCTNTSNPSVMLAAGLLAKKAVEKGLTVPSYVKTSLAPGSQVVETYLKQANLLESLEALKFHIVGYGCATCIGNSGPVPAPVADAVAQGNLVASAVVSGNRNFEGRISPVVKANYLASPPLVVAYALAGSVDFDFENTPLGKDKDGGNVFLADIWPSQQEINAVLEKALTPEMFKEKYSDAFTGSQLWQNIKVEKSELYGWDPASTYVREPSFFQGLTAEVPEPQPIKEARVLAYVGDSVTTDHISPAGVIASGSPAAKYLQNNGVAEGDFNSLGSRRGNHEVMMRGTFANIRLKNKLAPGTEGGVTIYLPTGEQTSIFDASMKYQETGTPLVVLAGKDYGMGSSRDWAAKGVALLGVKVVIAESYERIHRSNLIGMGILPLQFKEGENAQSLGLTGSEVFEVVGVEKELAPSQSITVVAKDGGNIKEITATVRIDTPVELDYYRNGGILQTVLRKLIK